MKKIILWVLLFFVIGWTASFAAQRRESLALNAADLKALDVNCGAGYLKIRGIDGLEQIEITAVLDVRGIADSELDQFKKEFVTLKLEKNIGRAELTAKIESDFSLAKLFTGSPDARIDLDVRVPRRLALVIDDGSGDVDIRDWTGSWSSRTGRETYAWLNSGARWNSRTVPGTSPWSRSTARWRSMTVPGTSSWTMPAATSVLKTVRAR